jgi:alpha-galactosidase
VDNLPQGCCVEVPCLVDGNGIQPTKIGSLPVQLAALNRTNINVQELTVEAALSGSKEAIYHAAMLDPLTAAVCTLPQIRSMVDEMLEAQSAWLPQF